MIEALLAALLSLLHPGLDTRRCIEANRPAIVAAIGRESEAHGIPPGVLTIVAFLESHWGCDRASGGSWGSPIDRNHRHTPGGPGPTARDLATSRRVFPSWVEALSRYRCGRCDCRPLRRPGYTAEYAVGLIARVYERAGYPAPPDLRPAGRRCARRRVAK